MNYVAVLVMIKQTYTRVVTLPLSMTHWYYSESFPFSSVFQMWPGIGFLFFMLGLQTCLGGSNMNGSMIHDDVHGVKMGMPLESCDDGKVCVFSDSSKVQS